MKEFNWDTATTICEVDGFKWLLGPEASDRMDWHDAKEWCEAQKGVLPLREVLLMAYLNQDIVGGFADAYYWSSSENNSSYAWYQHFSNGGQYSTNKNDTSFRVRAVRRMKMKEFNWDTAPIICELNGTKWLLGPEAEYPMDWENAKEWCKSQGGVLPPREILLHAYINKESLGGFTNHYYRSSSELNSDSAWLQDFDAGYQDSGSKHGTTFRVRAVRRIE
jgi:hypothetical protein